MDKPLTYADTGVNYEAMDPFKVLAQKAAARTADMLSPRHGAKEIEWSRGESAYLVLLRDGQVLGVVEEGLGTKNLVADAMRKITGLTYYRAIAQDTVAMMVNDLITLGVLPMVITMHVAAGDSAWFTDEERTRDLVDGWADACALSGACWGCGESPTLKGNVDPDGVVLSGSAVGIAKASRQILNPAEIREGDHIILLASNGIHANGLTLARKVAERLPKGYETPLPNGQTYGEALLQPTAIYVNPVAACLAGTRERGEQLIHGAVNITGHGWRKLMRARKSYAYVIERIPESQPEFRLIQEMARMDDREAYGTFNMGAGFALFASPKHANEVVSLCERSDCPAFDVGQIEKSDTRRVVIKPLDITYETEELQVR